MPHHDPNVRARRQQSRRRRLRPVRGGREGPRGTARRTAGSPALFPAHSQSRPPRVPGWGLRTDGRRSSDNEALRGLGQLAATAGARRSRVMGDHQRKRQSRQRGRSRSAASLGRAASKAASASAGAGGRPRDVATSPGPARVFRLSVARARASRARAHELTVSRRSPSGASPAGPGHTEPYRSLGGISSASLLSQGWRSG